jgi:DeoR/GlpR family transcriptional regulator of sugar metabolism
LPKVPQKQPIDDRGPEVAGAIPEERRIEIIDAVRSHLLVRADELALRFDGSVETIRRDLLALENEGLVRRVYGGATRVVPPA